MCQCDQRTYGTLPPHHLSLLLGQSLDVDCCRRLSLRRTLCLVFQCVESDRHGCFHQALMSAGEKTRDIFKPSGTPQPQVSAGLPLLESVLFESQKEKDLMDPPSLWNAVFVIDRWTDSVNPEEQTPARMLRGRSAFLFWSWWYLGFMQKNCETCWFVLGIHRSTGFEMKTFALYSELFASFSHYGTGSPIVFPLVFFTNSLSKPALLAPQPPYLHFPSLPSPPHHHLNVLLSLLFLCSSPLFWNKFIKADTEGKKMDLLCY